MAPAEGSSSLSGLEKGEGLRGLLISLLTIFDVKKTGTLTQDEYKAAAGPLGFDTSEEAWHALVLKYGEKNANNRPSTAEGAPTDAQVLDMQLIGAYFSNKYDPLLEEILRRLIRGIISTNARSESLEKRLKVVEDHLEATSMRAMRERDMKIKKTLRFWSNRTTAPVFDGWKKLVADQKHTLQKTLKHMMNRTISNVFRRWQDMVKEIKEARAAGNRAVQRWRLKFVTLCFDAWVQDTKDSIAHREELMLRAANSFVNSAVFGAFTHWKGVAVQEQRIKDLQRRIVIRLAYGVVFECFQAWAGYCGEETEKRLAQLRQAAMRMVHAALVQTFEAWVALVKQAYIERAEREQRALNLMQRMMHPYLVHTFEALKENREHNLAVKRKAAFAIGPGRLMHMVMRKWAQTVRELVKQRERDWVNELLAEAIPKLIDQSMNTGVADKVGASERQQQAIIHALQDEMATLQQQIDEMARELKAANERRLKEHETAVNRVLRQWRSAHVSRAFSAWCEALEQSRKMLATAAAHWKNLPLTHALGAWRDLAEYGRHLRHVAKTIGAKVAHRMSSAVFAEWHGVVRSALEIRNRGNLKALNMWINQQLSYFYPWRDFARRSVEVKAMGRRCLQRMVYASLYAAFDTWSTAVSEAKSERKALLARAAQRLFNRTLVRAFETWRDEYLRAKEHKRHLYQLAVRRFVNRQTSAVFDEWIAFVDRKKFILKRAGYYLGDGLMISHCFSSWKLLHARAQKLKQTEWLLNDLKLVGTGWLVETLDSLIPGSLPHGTSLHASVARAVDVAPSGQASPLPMPVDGGDVLMVPGPPTGAAADSSSLDAALFQPQPPIAPQPPIVPRTQAAAPGRPGAPGRHGGAPVAAAGASRADGVASRSESPVLGGPARSSAPSPDLDPPQSAGSDHGGALELPPPLPPIGAPPPPPASMRAPVTLTPAALPADPAAEPPPRTALTVHSDGGSTSAGGGSAAVHALGAFLEAQQRRSDWAVRRVYEMVQETKGFTKAESARLTSEMKELHRLQLEHASLSLADATKRQSDANHLDAQVASLAARLKEVDEQCFFLKDTLYSLLTVGSGKDGMPKAPAVSKKPLRPLKAALTAPWNSVTPGPGL